MIEKKIVNIIKRIWQRIVNALDIPLSYLVIKKSNLWVYYPFHFKAIAGDCIFLFDYVNKSDNHHVQQYILVNNDFVVNNTDYNSFIVNRYSLKGIWLSLRAKFIIIDTDGPFRKGKFSIIQLWHGTGYKNIIALSGKYSLEYNKKRLKNICFVPASSEADRERKVKSFLTDRVYLTGSPRNDFFFSMQGRYIQDDLRKILDIKDNAKVILYAPTYRSQEVFRPLSIQFFYQFQRMAEINNMVFLIKRHPIDNTTYDLGNYNDIHDITSKVKDVQELLLLSDILITDYSSIASDFALLDRPIIFYTYDFENYIENQRGFYYNLNKTLPGPFATSEDKLLELLSNLSWFYDELYQDKFKKYQVMFHQFKDGNSSKRVFDKIQEVLNINY